MFRKIVSMVCVCAFLFTLVGASQAAIKKKVVVKKKIVVQKTVVKQKVTTKVIVRPAPVVAPAPVPTTPRGGFYIEGGYGGGAGLVGIGLTRHFSEGFALALDANYGFGSGYSVILGRVGGELYLGKLFMGLAGAYANYSDKVGDIPGLSGNFDKGGHTGAELYLGYAFGFLRARLGYNTALAGGATASMMLFF